MTVKLNLGPLLKLKKGLPDRVFKQWAARYRGFVRNRFTTFARGGGNWPALAPSTIKRRRQGTKKGKRKSKRNKRGTGRIASILWDTGTLLGALAIRFRNAPGQLQRKIRNGIRVGFGGPARHPKGKATIADIARFHNDGLGVPQRKIIVQPDAATKRGMASDVERHWARTQR